MTSATERHQKSLRLLELRIQHEQAFSVWLHDLLQRTNERIMALEREKMVLESTDTRD